MSTTPDLGDALLAMPISSEPAPAAQPAPAPAAEAPAAAAPPPADAPPAAQNTAAETPAPTPDIPDALRPDYERFQKFAPLIDQFEQAGYKDADSYLQAQQQQQDRAQAEAFQQQAYQQILQEVQADPALTARVDEAEETGQITPELADELRTQLREREAGQRFQGRVVEYERQQQQARANRAAYEADRAATLARDEFKVVVNGERMALPVSLVDAIAAQNGVRSPEALSDAVRQTLSLIQPFVDAAVSQARASLAKQQAARPEVPAPSGAAPPMGGAPNWQRPPSLGSALMSLPVTRNGR